MKKLSELLTPRELDHVRLLADGFSNTEIARQSGLSPKYINNKLSVIYAKLGLGRPESGSPYDPRITLAVRYDREFGRGHEGGTE